MRPLIGYVPNTLERHHTLWTRYNYSQILVAAGATPVILSPDGDAEDVARVLSVLDGVLFTGGADVDPGLYGQRPTKQLQQTNPLRDTYEPFLYKMAYDRDMPMLGICRGIQFINVMHEGTLYQDIATDLPGSYEHDMLPPYDVASHGIEIYDNNPLREILGCSYCSVNSMHHQAIRDLGGGLEVTARSTDGIVEGVWDPSRRWMLAVQWHPEFAFTNDEKELVLVQAFVDACRHMS